MQKTTKVKTRVVVGALLLVVLVAYAPFLFYMWDLRSEQILNGTPEAEALPVYGPDADGYVTIAKNVLDHHVFSSSHKEPYLPDTFRTPGYPLFISVIMLLLGTHAAVPFVQLVLTAATGILIFLIGRNLWSERIGFWAALLYLIGPTTILHTLVIASEVPYIFVLFCALYVLFGVEQGKLRGGTRVGLFGLFLGLSALIRPISLYILPIAVVFYFVENRKEPLKKNLLSVLVMCLVFVAVIFPWLMRNKTVSGAWGLSSVGNYNFFHYHIPEFLSYKEGITADQGRLRLRARVSDLEGYELTDLKNSSRLAMIWQEEFLKNKFSYTSYHLFKTIPFFLSSGVENIFAFHERVLGYQIFPKSSANMTNLILRGEFRALLEELKVSPLIAVENIFWCLVVLFAFLALFFRHRRLEVVTFMLIIFYFAVATGLVAFARFRMPIASLLFILALVGFSSSMRAIWQRWKRAKAPQTELKNSPLSFPSGMKRVP